MLLYYIKNVLSTVSDFSVTLDRHFRNLQDILLRAMSSHLVVSENVLSS